MKTTTLADAFARFEKIDREINDRRSRAKLPDEEANALVSRQCKEFDNAMHALMLTPARTVGEFARKIAALLDVQARFFQGQCVFDTKRQKHYCGDATLAWSTAALEREAKTMFGMSIPMPAGRALRKAA